MNIDNISRHLHDDESQRQMSRIKFIKEKDSDSTGESD